VTPERLKISIQGVLAFLPTPFTPGDAVDLDGLAEHTDFLCRSGTHVVVVCGGVGEFFSLDLEEYRTCIRTAVAAAGGRVPVIAGIGYSTRTACHLAQYAESAGADGLMINPTYFIEPSEDGMFQHYRALAQATNLGMIVFSTKGSVYTPLMVQRLAEIPSVIALKDEYGDLKMFVETMEGVGDRLALINGMAEPMAAPYFGAGARAMTSGIVNVVPEVSLAIWNAGVAGRFAELRELVARIRPLARLRERRKGYHIPVIKEAMNLLGRPGGAVRLPLVPLTPADREDLQRILVDLGCTLVSDARTPLQV
jgi:5-dehydro-4-deoxyglucarate dehydratase